MKKKFLKFINEKGIAKKLLNYLERNGTTKISVIALRMISIMLILSLVVNFCFITKIGIVIQQGIIFIVKVFNGVVSNVVYTLAYYDSRSPGTLSMLGTIINSFIGFIAVVLVFIFQTRREKRNEIKNLMSLLLNTYRAVNIFTITGVTVNLKDQNNKEFIKKYSNLVYDKNWGAYLKNIKKYEDAETLMKWFFAIEQSLYLESKNLDSLNEQVEKILKKHGFRVELSKVKYELELLQKEEDSKRD